MATTRARALEAAVELLGTAGLRALTHGRVDDRAGLPKGSTSNFFRTRAALLSGVVDWIVAQEMREVGDGVSPETVDEYAQWMSRLVDVTTQQNRTMTTARLVLFLEASHDPALREALARGRESMEAANVALLRRLGARDPHTAAAAMMACAEGVILHRIARGADTDARALFQQVAQGALA